MNPATVRKTGETIPEIEGIVSGTAQLPTHGLTPQEQGRLLLAALAKLDPEMGPREQIILTRILSITENQKLSLALQYVPEVQALCARVASILAANDSRGELEQTGRTIPLALVCSGERGGSLSGNERDTQLAPGFDAEFLEQSGQILYRRSTELRIQLFSTTLTSVRDRLPEIFCDHIPEWAANFFGSIQQNIDSSPLDERNCRRLKIERQVSAEHLQAISILCDDTCCLPKEERYEAVRAFLHARITGRGIEEASELLDQKMQSIGVHGRALRYIMATSEQGASLDRGRLDQLLSGLTNCKSSPRIKSLLAEIPLYRFQQRSVDDVVKVGEIRYTPSGQEAVKAALLRQWSAERLSAGEMLRMLRGVFGPALTHDDAVSELSAFCARFSAERASGDMASDLTETATSDDMRRNLQGTLARAAAASPALAEYISRELPSYIIQGVEISPHAIEQMMSGNADWARKKGELFLDFWRRSKMTREELKQFFQALRPEGSRYHNDVYGFLDKAEVGGVFCIETFGRILEQHERYLPNELAAFKSLPHHRRQYPVPNLENIVNFVDALPEVVGLRVELYKEFRKSLDEIAARLRPGLQVFEEILETLAAAEQELATTEDVDRRTLRVALDRSSETLGFIKTIFATQLTPEKLQAEAWSDERILTHMASRKDLESLITTAQIAAYDAARLTDDQIKDLVKQHLDILPAADEARAVVQIWLALCREISIDHLASLFVLADHFIADERKNPTVSVEPVSTNVDAHVQREARQTAFSWQERLYEPAGIFELGLMRDEVHEIAPKFLERDPWWIAERARRNANSPSSIRAETKDWMELSPQQFTERRKERTTSPEQGQVARSQAILQEYRALHIGTTMRDRTEIENLPRAIELAFNALGFAKTRVTVETNTDTALRCSWRLHLVPALLNFKPKS